MGLLDKLFGKVERRVVVDRPDPLDIQAAPHVVCAPASGQLMAMADIPDPVFACGAMGPAVGIKPDAGVVYAPVSGTVTLTTGTLHALGLRSDNGVEILIHMGVDTVNMKGDGFTGFVEKGQRVSAGEALLVMDLEKVAAAGYSDVVITVVTNADDFAPVIPVEAGPVCAGAQVMTVTL